MWLDRSLRPGGPSPQHSLLSWSPSSSPHKDEVTPVHYQWTKPIVSLYLEIISFTEQKDVALWSVNCIWKLFLLLMRCVCWFQPLPCWGETHLGGQVYGLSLWKVMLNPINQSIKTTQWTTTASGSSLHWKAGLKRFRSCTSYWSRFSALYKIMIKLDHTNVM